jgi:hypothetical protein
MNGPVTSRRSRSTARVTIAAAWPTDSVGISRVTHGSRSSDPGQVDGINMGAASRALDHRRNLTQLVLAAREQQDLGALGGHRSSRGGSEALRSPGDEHRFAGKLHRAHPLFGQTARRNPPHGA